MMMAGLFSVVWSTVRETSQLRESEITRWPATQLIEQMRHDFQNARGMIVTPTGVSLHGFLDQDLRTRIPTLRSGSVHYELADQSGRRFLMRTVTGASGSRREPVWMGLGSLQIESLSQTDEEDALLLEPETGGLPLVPATFQVTLLGERSQVIWREVIHHHAD
jgi:hypothetical protein